MRTGRRLLIPLLLIGVLGASCGSDSATSAPTSALTSAPTAATNGPSTTAGASGSIVVFAASSLTEAFGEIGTAFTAANPAAKVAFDFAGSGDLVTQIVQGAPADVFASADETNMTKLSTAGETAGSPVVVAANTMEIIVEHGNPKGITGLADLAKPGLTVVLCAETAPCGKSAAATLENAGITLTPKSLEDKVKGVVTKVTTGEADAGIVFATDVEAAGSAAAGIEIPASVNVINKYPVVVTKSSGNPSTAQAFVDFVASPAGRAILVKHGFLAP